MKKKQIIGLVVAAALFVGVSAAAYLPIQFQKICFRAVQMI